MNSGSIFPCEVGVCHAPSMWVVHQTGSSINTVLWGLLWRFHHMSEWSRSVVSDSLQPHGLWPTRLLSPWNFPGKSTGVGCHFLLQGIFPTQGSNPGLLHCRQMLYHLSHQGRLWRLMEVSSHRLDWLLTQLLVLLPSMENGGWGWKFQASSHGFVFLVTSPHPGIHQKWPY